MVWRVDLYSVMCACALLLLLLLSPLTIECNKQWCWLSGKKNKKAEKKTQTQNKGFYYRWIWIQWNWIALHLYYFIFLFCVTFHSYLPFFIINRNLNWLENMMFVLFKFLWNVHIDALLYFLPQHLEICLFYWLQYDMIFYSCRELFIHLKISLLSQNWFLNFIYELSSFVVIVVVFYCLTVSQNYVTSVENWF